MLTTSFPSVPLPAALVGLHSRSPQTKRPLEIDSRAMIDYKEEEGKMEIQDRIIVETAEAMNALESYIYSMRDHVTGDWARFGTDDEKKALMEAFEELENWLYEDGKGQRTRHGTLGASAGCSPGKAMWRRERRGQGQLREEARDAQGTVRGHDPARGGE